MDIKSFFDDPNFSTYREFVFHQNFLLSPPNVAGCGAGSLPFRLISLD